MPDSGPGAHTLMNTKARHIPFHLLQLWKAWFLYKDSDLCWDGEELIKIFELSVPLDVTIYIQCTVKEQAINWKLICRNPQRYKIKVKYVVFEPRPPATAVWWCSASEPTSPNRLQQVFW